VFWTAEGEVYFVEVLNGHIQVVLEGRLSALIAALPEDLVLGFLTHEGKLAFVGKSRLQ
jgi:hypothetical protein